VVSKEDLRLGILPVDLIDAALPVGTIYEIGSGYGVLGWKLAALNARRKIIAIDKDTQKIATANQRYKLANLSFASGDALTYPYKSCAGAILSDFLHHLPYGRQDILLKRVASKIKSKGVLVVKEIDRTDFVRMLLSRMWDFIFYPRDKIYYRNKSELVSLITKLGFKVTARRAVLWFPGSTVLYTCIKK
jgi:2-polyprenyl-3-methyl-5-hydroxy-6-metoxy-1,4-benzoquinol methylase